MSSRAEPKKKPAKKTAKKPAKKPAKRSSAKRPVIRVSKGTPKAPSQPVKSDRWVKCIISDGNIRAVAIEATALVRDLSKRHKLSKVGSIGLGEAVLAAALIASSVKNKEKVNLNIQGDGAFSQALVDASADGVMRGYVVERKKRTVSKFSQDLGPWGNGLLSVLRTQGSGEPPYIGTVPLLTGHLAKDLTFYWFQSEQIPSAVGIGVYLDERGKVIAAAGFLVQAMPGADESEVKLIQRQLLHLSNLKERVVESGDPVQLLAKVLEGMPFTIVEDRPIKFGCSCSLERVERSLRLLGPKELTSILKEDGKAKVTCDFCATDYLIKAPALKRLISSHRA